MTWLRGLSAGILVFTILGCSSLSGLMGPTGNLVDPAESLLKAGDLPGAAREYERLSKEHPDSVDVAVGRAYTQLVSGDIDGADATLAAIEAKAGEKASEIRLRRALVALEKKDLDKVKEFGEASGLPEGQLLAAEVHLVDLDSDKAMEILTKLKDQPGIVGDTAKTYHELVASGDQHKGALAEASALWALGDRAGAVDSVEDSLKGLPEDDPTKGLQILLWAGRAATSGRPDVTKQLLEDTFPPDGQQWRYQATRAIGLVAEGDVPGARTIFDGLKAAADTPKDGLADALATACALAPAESAKELVAGMESAAAARCLLQAGAIDAAKAKTVDGAMKQFLEGQ